MFNFVIILRDNPKMFFHEDEEQDAITTYLHYRQIYGHMCNLYRMKFDPNDEVIKLTKVKVERKENYVYRNRRK